MNTSDWLENELASLQPQPPSNQLQQRIGRQLTPVPATPARAASLDNWPLRAVVSGLTALVLCAVLQSPIPKWNTGPQHKSAMPVVNAEKSIDPSPSVWTYRKALARSAAAVEALLNQHSHDPSNLPPESMSTVAFSRSHVAPGAHLGEL